MIKPAFSTVACPDSLLSEVIELAASSGFEAVELRTFGDDSRRFACDPSLTSEPKTRDLLATRGVEAICLGTSCRFDAPILPPILGLYLPEAERTVREAKRAVDLAVGLECPFVRVFGFELPARENRAAAIARIVRRLRQVLDHAHNTGVRVVIENAGSFPRATDVLELIRRCEHPLVGACYSAATAHAAGEDPASGVAVLGDRLWVGRIKDLRGGAPCALGEGTVPCREFTAALAAASFDGPLVFEWDRAWMPGLAPAGEVLPRAARTLCDWIGQSGGPSPRPGPRLQTPA